MKKTIILAFLAIFSGVLVTSCGSDGETTTDTNSETTTASSYNSEYFEQAVFADGGDFLGLTLGDSKEAVKGKLPQDAFADEEDNYVYYEWMLGNNNYYLDLYFDDEDKLNSIDGTMYFYDAENYYDKGAAKLFYKDMKAFFVDKYGDVEEEKDGEALYSDWYLDEMDAGVSMDEGAVYWYQYAYEDYDI